MHILISLIIFLVIAGLIWYLIGLLPIPAPFKTIVNVLFILLAILFLVHLAGWWAWT